MTIGDMFVLVLVVLVLPCSTLEGKCHIRPKGRLLLKGREVSASMNRQDLVEFSLLASSERRVICRGAIGASLLQKNKITVGHTLSLEVPSTYSSGKMCTGCQCSPSSVLL